MNLRAIEKKNMERFEGKWSACKRLTRGFKKKKVGQNHTKQKITKGKRGDLQDDTGGRREAEKEE